jgi:hypothetical protein
LQFQTLLLVSTNFGSLHYFLGIKSIKKIENSRTVPGRIRSGPTVHGSRGLPRAVGRPAS